MSALRRLTDAVRERLSGFRRREEGATAVEFALLGVPFFMLFLALFEVSMMLLAERSLQEALADAGRAIRTGQARSDISLNDFRNNYVCPKVALIKCDNIFVEVRTFSAFEDIENPPTNPDFSDPTNDPDLEFSIGGPSTVTTVRMFYKWQFHTPLIGGFFANIGDGKTRVLNAGTVFRSEPYS